MIERRRKPISVLYPGKVWPPSLTPEQIEKRIDEMCGCKGGHDCDCISVFNQACSKAWYFHNSHGSEA